MSETCGGNGTHNKTIVLRGTVKPKQTNANRLRSMDDEELAVWISALYTTQYHVRGDPDFWLDWLREEAKT